MTGACFISGAWQPACWGCVSARWDSVGSASYGFASICLSWELRLNGNLSDS